MAGHYKDLATGIVLLSVGFCLGTIYSNWTFDFHLLWESPTKEEWITLAVDYYKLKAEQSIVLHHVLHGAITLGFFGIFAKLYKPSESNTLFDGGSLALLLIATIFYITNMRPASYSLQTGDWGNIDAFDGVRLIAASQVLIVLVLFGVVAMQAGQWWAIPSAAQKAAYEAALAAETAETNAQQETKAETQAEAQASGSSSGKAKKRK